MHSKFWSLWITSKIQVIKLIISCRRNSFFLNLIDLNSFQHFLYSLSTQCQIHIYFFNLFLHLRELINLSLQKRIYQVLLLTALQQTFINFSENFSFYHNLAPINIPALILFVVSWFCFTSLSK